MRHAPGLLLIGLVSAVLSIPVSAQRVRVSPHETHEFDVDGAHISITYGRPSKKGRVTWGTLVPSEKWWMPGADEATTIVTNKAIVIGGLTMPAGEHTIYALMDEKSPKLIINKETGQFHTVYHPNLDLGRVDLTMRKIDPIVEMLTFEVKRREGGGGVLMLSWDDREYSVNFAVK